ncbi:MAG: ATP phosphoribosyltransferase regulatory subunit [Alphaproteobacteria bacterium]|nr:ATP phosphoribosyltransferase regulatory subunit [Alphaproteobacteria bacterium]
MEEAQQKPLATRLSSASDVIDALGGTNIVADMLEIGASSVSNYRKQGFPARSHFILAKICAERGLDVADAVFGGYQLQARPKPYARTPEPATDALTRLEEAGFSRLSLPILQPAAPFIDRMGPEMQRRLFTFTDPGGEQLCLRPDLTIPTALAHIASGKANTRGEARYCYQGTAFRYQPRGSGQPEEFTQLGLEIIGGTGDLDDDLAVLTTIIDRLKEAGLSNFKLNFTDPRPATGYIDALSLSPRATARLKRCHIAAANADDFRDIALNGLEQKSVKASPVDDDVVIAGRSGAEINSHLNQKQEEAADKPALEKAVNDLIAYLDNMDALRQTIDPRLLDMADSVQTGFGRGMAYYTGLSFEIYAQGIDRPIAAGGRYDDLLKSLGADTPLPAVGGAISLERLTRAVEVQ